MFIKYHDHEKTYSFFNLEKKSYIYFWFSATVIGFGFLI